MLKLSDAQKIANHFQPLFEPFCEPDGCRVAGSVRREIEHVHDLEFVLKPILKAPRAIFGQKVSNKNLMKTLLDQYLYEQVQAGVLVFKSGGERNKKYWVDLAQFDIEPHQTFDGPGTDEFILDLWVTVPPAQFGVNMVIRTGPGHPTDHFSKWVVTPRSGGGALPDGYRVKHGAVWSVAQLDAKGEPFEDETPLQMPTEEDFMAFLGWSPIDEIYQPSNRHADWGRYTR